MISESWNYRSKTEFALSCLFAHSIPSEGKKLPAHVRGEAFTWIHFDGKRDTKARRHSPHHDSFEGLNLKVLFALFFEMMDTSLYR